MHWDGTISLGSLLEAMVLALGLFGVALKLDRRLTKLEVKMNILFGKFFHSAREAEEFFNGKDIE